jgi:N-acetylglucosaminyldiphosphoundecaprenol N-acetyl-beta-D-mannosaminyltransferase
MCHFILGMRLDTTSYEEATKKIIAWAKVGESRSILAANTHLVMESYDSNSFRSVTNSSDLVTPDGMPLVWWLRAKGVKNQQRVYGPELMLHVCQSAAKEKVPVGLLGSTQVVIKALVEQLMVRFPELQINFINSPPYRTLSTVEDDILIQQIRDSGVKILFVGLGCPKQELWIDEHMGKVKAAMLGVGAAFQFHSGATRQAPHWIQNIGFEWMFRLTQEPRRLWKRYFIVIPRFSYLVIMEALGAIHVR